MKKKQSRNQKFVLSKLLHIGPCVYTVDTFGDDDFDNGNSDFHRCRGHCESDECQISIYSEQSDEQQLDTLGHEIMHVVVDQLPKTYIDVRDHEEWYVCAIATGLLAVFKQNPGLLKLVERTLK